MFPTPEKAEVPRVVTLSPIVALVKLVQPRKAELPMLVTLSGMVTLFSPLQPKKAELPMLVTLSGIITDPCTVRLHQRRAFFSAESKMNGSSAYLLTYFAPHGEPVAEPEYTMFLTP